MGGEEPRNLVRPGAAVTAAYLLAIAIYAVVERMALLSMTPNQFADFLAGCFAPLAFLWLVLGFFQQGDELRNSVAALKLQGEELRHSVEQQRQLVEVTREQLGIDRASQGIAAAEAARRAAPIFHISGGFNQWSSPLITCRFSIRNLGAECRQVLLSDESGNETRLAILGKEERMNFEYEFTAEQKISDEILTIECINSLNQQLKFSTVLSAVSGQYGPEYAVASKDGLFAQIVDVQPAIEQNSAVVPEKS